MTWIDYVVTIVIAFSCLVGLIRGFVKEVLSLLTFGFAFFIASRYYSYLSSWFTGFENKTIRNIIVFTVLFIAILIVGSIISSILGQLVVQVGLSRIDKILGICFGILRGILIVAVILFLLDTFTLFTKSKDCQKSHLIPLFSWMIRSFFDYIHRARLVFI